MDYKTAGCISLYLKFISTATSTGWVQYLLWHECTPSFGILPQPALPWRLEKENKAGTIRGHWVEFNRGAQYLKMRAAETLERCWLSPSPISTKEDWAFALPSWICTVKVPSLSSVKWSITISIMPVAASWLILVCCEKAAEVNISLLGFSLEAHANGTEKHNRW